jgi:signal transduction protein with GAF and PtsI domain
MTISMPNLKRLEDALGSLRISIDDMLSRRDVSMEGEHRAVLEAYRMFAHDRAGCASSRKRSATA